MKGSLVAQMIKNLPAMQETKVRSLEEGMAYPLKHFCLENSMDRGAWQTIVYEVSKSRTQLSD